ncbi:MAG: type III PLP-dependent enzyme [Pseudomonadota bacterium]
MTQSPQPVRLRPYGVPTFRTAHDAISAYAGDDHVYALYPRRIERAARTFVSGFPGQVLFAVKANPHPSLLNILWREGVRQFDVASLREISLIQALFPEAKMYLMNPVKSRRTIAVAYENGIRDIAFDHQDELDKIIEVTGEARDLTLHLRLALPETDAAMPLCGKYGAGFDEALTLLPKARRLGARIGLCFHVGSQCLNVESYDIAIAYVRVLLDAAQVEIDSLDLGGGFPVPYPGMTLPPLQTYFDAIRQSLTKHRLADIEMIGEPGRALCAEGGSTLARVELRKGQDLYLNDGTYGSLFDAGAFDWPFPVKLHRFGARLPRSTQSPFRFFGPTCDSVDVMNGPFYLPDDVREGDWVEIEHVGAYGQALASQFNGFHSDHMVALLEDMDGGTHG